MSHLRQVPLIEPDRQAGAEIETGELPAPDLLPSGRYNISRFPITPEMVRAGLSALDSCLMDGNDSVTVEEIYIAMREAERSQ